MIVRSGSRWILFSHEGRILGTHATKHDAQAQEHAIGIRKARAAGHRIRRAPRRKLRGAGWRAYGKRRASKGSRR